MHLLLAEIGIGSIDHRRPESLAPYFCTINGPRSQVQMPAVPRRNGFGYTQHVLHSDGSVARVQQESARIAAIPQGNRSWF